MRGFFGCLILRGRILRGRDCAGIFLRVRVQRAVEVRQLFFIHFKEKEMQV